MSEINEIIQQIEIQAENSGEVTLLAEHAKQLVDEIDGLNDKLMATGQHPEVVYENIASTLLLQMKNENIDNFTCKVFGTTEGAEAGRDFELICRYLDGKSTADVLNEQQAEIEALKAEVAQLKAANTSQPVSKKDKLIVTLTNKVNSHFNSELRVEQVAHWVGSNASEEQIEEYIADFTHDIDKALTPDDVLDLWEDNTPTP